jgi:hypothetical protein
VDERKREAGTLAALQAGRSTVAAKGRQVETEAAPIRYVAKLLGADTDSERAIRWLIALMVLCCDPLAIALTAAASARWTVTACPPSHGKGEGRASPGLFHVGALGNCGSFEISPLKLDQKVPTRRPCADTSAHRRENNHGN